MDRRVRFREYLERLDNSRPNKAIDRGLFVEHGKFTRAPDIAKTLELEPASRILLLGALGSGKSTQLLVARRGLESEEEFGVISVHLDWSAKHGLNRGEIADVTGALFAAKLQKDAFSKAIEAFEKKRKGALARGSSDSIAVVAAEWYDALFPLMAETRRQFSHLVVMIDGLDRLSNLHEFESKAGGDLDALEQLKVGFTVVAPIHVGILLRPSFFDRFDRVFSVPVIDVQRDFEGREFLSQVLRNRADEDILPDTVVGEIVTKSGGVMRDLVQIARIAGMEAYRRGSDNIDVEHVRVAVHEHAHRLLMGTPEEEAQILRRFAAGDTNAFQLSNELCVKLLSRRLVVGLGDGLDPQQFIVHPALDGLLGVRAKTQ